MELLGGQGQDQRQSSFARCHDELRRTVRTAVRRQVRVVAQADEVEQAVMTELWIKADRIDWSDGCPHGWASTVATRRAIDHMRSDQSRISREDRVDREQDQTVAVTAEDVMVRLDRAALIGALDDLNPKQREAIVLAYFGDQSYADVARELGLPVGTVKRRIRDGMFQLRSKLGDLR